MKMATSTKIIENGCNREVSAPIHPSFFSAFSILSLSDQMSENTEIVISWYNFLSWSV